MYERSSMSLPDIFIPSALLKKKKKRPVAAVGLNSTPVVIGGEWLRRPVRWFWTLFTFNRFIKAIIEASKQFLWKSELSKDWGKRIDVWWRRTSEKRLVRNASVWTPLMSIEECTSKGNFMPNNLHYSDVMDAECSKKVLSCRRFFFRSRSPAISRELTTLFSLESQDLMMSVFCSNTPVFASKCLKCIERGPDFKIFPETRAFGVRKSRLCRKVFPSPLTPTLLPPP